MSDPVEQLIEKLRDHENEGVTGSDRFHLREEAADALARLREENEQAREFFRKQLAVAREDVKFYAEKAGIRAARQAEPQTKEGE